MIPMFRVLMSDAAPAAVAGVIASGTITEGPRVKELEGRLGGALGLPGSLASSVSPVLAVNSGTSALHLALTLLDLAPGDEVISTPITCAATSCAIVRAGGTIVWADVDPHTGLLDARDVARRVTPRTRAVVCVDWGGAPCDVAALRDAAGVPVIEDAAHAFGAARAGDPPDAACWSFQAIKHLTTGDGGALFVRDSQARERARMLRWFGIDRDAVGPNIDKPIGEAGFKYHMSDLVAAIGLANLPLAVAAVERHRANAAWYADALRGVSGVRAPPANHGSAWWLYTLILEPDDARQGFIRFMAARGIECSRVHARNDTHRAFGAGPVDLPGAAYFDGHQVAIPVGWWVGDETRERIAEAVREWAK